MDGIKWPDDIVAATSGKSAPSSGRVAPGRGARRVAITVIVLIVVLAGAWFTGLLGRFLTAGVLPLLLPIHLKNGVTLTAVETSHAMTDSQQGVTLAILPGRLERFLDETLPGASFLPPGLVWNGLEVRGDWAPLSGVLPGGLRVPVRVVVENDAGEHPRLTIRYPKSEVNRVTRRILTEKWEPTVPGERGESGMLYSIVFDALQVESVNDGLEGRLTSRRLVFEGTGAVFFQTGNSLLDVEPSAALKEFRGHVEVKVNPAGSDIRLGYEAGVDQVKAEANAMKGWTNDKLSATLKESIAETLNRPKFRRFLTSRRWPSSLPLDLIVDAKLGD